ncbi:tetratricopeptide repeat protein [Meridianimarinicoccus sp. RP-17]|uniref:tetratricopeptide repeat protein n=1 Tax=Meridianimarinicoccus zhengii TaxID=2056810 RepID=UPI000DAD3359|nr:tetratricopeptide repeat protein [Phycocomes zhengii]
MSDDICRAETGLATAEALAAWNAMVRAVLAHGAAAPAHLATVLEHEPDAPMALAARGLFCLMLGRSEMVAAARGSSAEAHRALATRGGPARAAAWLSALDGWLDGSPGAAVFHLEGVLARNPSDTLTAKACHGVRFIMGDAGGMRRSIERALAGHGADHPLRGFALGCHAFALEETGDYAAAEATGLAGLDLAPDDAWGLHAVAHVHDMTHRPDAGIALIERNAAAWDHCNNFRYHVWWHKALLHLDRGEHDLALSLYDTRIREDRTDDYRDMANAASLLVRLELEDVPVGDRWGELADLAEARVGDGCLVFADLHYMLALTGDARPDAAGRLLAQVAGTGRDRTELGRVAAHPGVTAAEGLAAFGEGRYDRAFARLQAARAHMQTIGGSHAQRDVFERMTVDAGIRGGRLDDAAAILAARTALRGGHADSFARTRLDRIADARRVSNRAAE